MDAPTPSEAAKKARAIRRFNKAAQAPPHFEARRKAETSRTVFFDDDPHKALECRQSSLAWCTIPPRMAAWLAASATTGPVIGHETRTELRPRLREQREEACRAEAPKYLEVALHLYLGCHLELAQSYDEERRAKVVAAIASLVREFRDGFEALLREPSLVAYVKRRLFGGQPKPEAAPAPEPYPMVRKRSGAEVLRLKEERKYSVKDICRLSKISQSKFYEICKRRKFEELHPSGPPAAPTRTGGLTLEQSEHVKKLADDPARSFTVPDMCDEMAREHHWEVSRKVVYRHLTQTLGYSYQRNHFKPATAFQPAQKAVNFQVCKALLDFQREGRNIICLDEAGFHLGVQKEYSYAKRSHHPFRVGRQSVSKLSIIMAITSRQVFAYQVRKANHNEHSFIAFVLDLARELHRLGPDYESRAVLFLDNAPFHTSRLAMKLLAMLPFPVLFNAPNWSDLNPIESIFSVLKARLKKRNPTDRYLHPLQ